MISPALKIAEASMPAPTTPGARPSTELFELNAAAEHSRQAAKTKAKRKKGIEFKSGSIVVRMYPTWSGKKPKPPFTIAWREPSGGRKRCRRSDEAKAEQFARQKAIELANGDTYRAGMTSADRATLQRVQEILLPIGESPELAASIYTQCVQMMRATGASPLEACRSYLERLPAGIVAKPIPEIVKEFLEAKRNHTYGKRKANARWLGTLTRQVQNFGSKFGCPLQSLTAHKLADWVNSTGSSPKTRQGFLSAARALEAFAKFKRYLPATWDELKRVEIPEACNRSKRIYSPEQMVKMLRACSHPPKGRPNPDAKMLPFICCAGFLGIRNEEMSRKGPVLEWRDLNFKTKICHVREEVAKGRTGERFIRMPANLIAWLKPLARMTGPICTVKNTSNALTRIKTRAGLPHAKGEAPNVLRKSCQTYKNELTDNLKDVAAEGGHSQEVAKRIYIAATIAETAKAWFAIFPDDEGILQLDFALG